MATTVRMPLTDYEKLLVEAAKSKNIDEVKRYLKEDNVKVDCLDENGMSPLQHAAYYGCRELCELLVDHGADVNSNEHDHKYTALMFASLSGKLNCVSFLLENGASTSAINSIGRTAAQMAGFVSNHEVVALINNFLPKEEIDYFTVPHGLEKEAKLPFHLATPLYKLLLMTNIHPVKVALCLEQQNVLMQNIEKVIKVLDALCDKLFKNSGETNEVLILKVHHVACIMKACTKCVEEKKDVNLLIKSWLKNESYFPVNLERFLRQSIREFPFHDSAMFQQLVRTLAPVKIGEEPSAISILMSAINGQRATADTSETCATCGESRACKKCSACKAVQYCDPKCQKLHWFTHKKECTKLGEEKKLEMINFEKLKLENDQKSKDVAENENNTVSEDKLIA